MTRVLKFHWALWTLITIFVVGGTICDYFSSAKLVTFELYPNASVDVSVFRPIPHAVNLSLTFNRNDWKKRPELGDYAMTGASWPKTGFLEFPNPGVPIKLSVRGEDGKTVIYEALPTNSYSETTETRELFPFVDDGNPSQFKWPPSLALRVPLRSGISTLNISVLDVGPQLKGERVTLVIESPISFKSVASGYGFLWWFMFWPLYALLLVGYGTVLLRKSMHHRRIVAAG